MPSVISLVGALLLATMCSSCREGDSGTAAPIAVTEAHGRLTLSMTLAGGVAADRDAIIEVLATRFKALSKWTPVDGVALIPLGQADISLEVAVRVDPLCHEGDVARRVRSLTALATRKGEFAMHVLPPRPRVSQVLSRIRTRAGDGVTVTQHVGMPGALTVRGGQRALRAALSRLDHWPPLTGYRLLPAALQRDGEAILYVVRSRPSLDGTAIASATAAPDRGTLSLRYSGAGAQRLASVTEDSGGSLLLTRIDGDVLHTEVVTGSTVSGHLLLRPPGPPDRIRRYAVLLNGGALPTALQVTAQSSDCMPRGRP